MVLKRQSEKTCSNQINSPSSDFRGLAVLNPLWSIHVVLIEYMDHSVFLSRDASNPTVKGVLITFGAVELLVCLPYAVRAIWQFQSCMQSSLLKRRHCRLSLAWCLGCFGAAFLAMLSTFAPLQGKNFALQWFLVINTLFNGYWVLALFCTRVWLV